MGEAKVRLHGLTKFDRSELGKMEGLEYSEEELDAGAHGEVTTFTVVFTMALISTLAAYLLRKHKGSSFEEYVEIIHSDGRIERRKISWNSHSSEAPEADIIKQIRGGL